MARRTNKWNAKKVTIDGIVFDSLAEGRRYKDLKLLLHTGYIRDLKTHGSPDIVFEVHPSYVHPVTGKNIRAITYSADFSYFDNEQGIVVIEDVKGVQTDVFKIKRKIVEHKYGIHIKAFKY